MLESNGLCPNYTLPCARAASCSSNALGIHNPLHSWFCQVCCPLCNFFDFDWRSCFHAKTQKSFSLFCVDFSPAGSPCDPVSHTASQSLAPDLLLAPFQALCDRHAVLNSMSITECLLQLVHYSMSTTACPLEAVGMFAAWMALSR